MAAKGLRSRRFSSCALRRFAQLLRRAMALNHLKASLAVRTAMFKIKEQCRAHQRVRLLGCAQYVRGMMRVSDVCGMPLGCALGCAGRCCGGVDDVLCLGLCACACTF